MNIITLDYDKIRELIDYQKKENIKFTKKTLKNKKKIMKTLKNQKADKIKQTKKKITKNSQSCEIIRFNQKLIKDLQILEDLEESISSIEENSFKNFVNDFLENLSETTTTEEYIEYFSNEPSRNLLYNL